MALVKTFKGNEIGSTIGSYFMGTGTVTSTNYITYLGDKNYALVEDPNQDDLYFADSSNDSLTLVPHYNKALTFEKEFKSNLRHGFNSKLLFTSKPSINARFNFRTTEGDEETYTSQISNRFFKNNLDIQDAYLGGNFQQRNVGGTLYTFLSIPTQSDNGRAQSSTYNTAPTGNILIIKGDDYSTAEYISFKTDMAAFDILTVDTDSRIIYLSTARDSRSDVQDGEYIFQTNTSDILYALTYETVLSNGVFEFGQLIELIRENSYWTSQAKSGPPLTISYLGNHDDGEPCFILTHNDAPNITATGLTASQLGIQFLKVDSNQVKNQTSYININNRYSVLDCFTTHLLTLSADTSNPGDYAEYQHNVIPSKGHNFDPAAPEIFWYYLPYFSNQGNLKLTAIEWNKSETTWGNAFTLYANLNQNIQINGELSGVTQTSFPAFNPTLSTLSNYAALYEAHCLAYITNDTKLHLTFNHIDSAVYNDLNPTQFNNTLSFSIDSANPESITWETISNIPSLNSMVLKDYTANTYNELVVLSPDSCRFYTYNSVNGWTLAHSEPGTFSEFTQDSKQRRWALEAPVDNNPAGYEELATEGYFYLRMYQSKLHLLSQVLPYTTSIEFQNTNVTYINNNVPNSLVVNAYDETGSRIAADVNLTIQGTNMVFDINTNDTTKTVTTSNNGDTSVQVVITGPGYVNVSASFVI